jgi:hypothetical protein
MSGGGTSSSTIDEEIKKSSALPVVLGVDFYRAKLVSPVFDTKAVTSANAVASESGRTLWQTQNRATLGETAVLTQRGGGQGNACGGGVPSTVDLRSSLELSPQPAESAAQSFELRTTGSLSGSLFRTGDIFNGCGAQSGDVRASVFIDARVRTLVRSSSAKAIHVSLDRIDDAEVTVKDWTDKELSASSTTGTERVFALPGAGVYNVRVLGRRTVSASGPEFRQVNEQGNFKVFVQ